MKTPWNKTKMGIQLGDGGGEWDPTGCTASTGGEGTGGGPLCDIVPA